MIGLGPFHHCLLAAVNGNSSLVVFPDQQTYTAVVEPYNFDIPVTPAAVIFPKSAEQVAAAVLCATHAGVKVQPRSGGHNYGNFGSTTGELSIHLDNLKHFSLDKSSFLAKVGSGMLLDQLNLELYNAGQRSIPHGISLNIGIGGHATVGGFGATSRASGFTLDHVVEVEVVLADSAIVRASETKNPDLFFAVKGAAASFGVVTEFVFKTDPAPSSTVDYLLAWPAANASTRAAVFKAWQKWIYEDNVPWHMSSTLTITPGFVSVSGAFFGMEEDFAALQLPSLYASSPPDSVSTQLHTDYNAASNHWFQQIIASGLAFPAYFAAKCIAFERDTRVPDDAADRFFAYLESTANGTDLWAVNFEVLGGAVNEVAPDASAMPHRDLTFVMLSYAQTPGPVSRTTYDFVDGMNAAITSGHPDAYYPQYAGYVDARQDADEARKGYWRANLPRLRKIKRRVDPRDVFHNLHSVPVS